MQSQLTRRMIEVWRVTLQLEEVVDRELEVQLAESLWEA